MPSESAVALRDRTKKALPWCFVLVIVAAGTLVVTGVVDRQPADSGAAQTFNAAVSSTIEAKSFIECVQSTYLPAADGCMTYHGPDQLAIDYRPPNSGQKRIYSVDRVFSSLGYGDALSGSAQSQAEESAALQSADLWTVDPMTHSEVVSEVHSSVFPALDLLRSFRGRLTQSGTNYRITSPNGALTASVTIQHGFITGVITRMEVGKGKWTTRVSSLSTFNSAPPIELPGPQSIVGRVNGDGCAEQSIVPQCL